jgi:hypothetical protein
LAFSEVLAEEAVAFVRRFLRTLGVGVELDGQIAVVVDVAERRSQRDPVEVPFARNHVVVLAAGEVFDVHVPDSARQPAHGVADVFADDDAVADVEVGAEARVVQSLDPVLQLGDVFEEEPRLELDAEVDAERFGLVEHRSDRLGELLCRLVRRHRPEAPAARDADIVRADVLGKLQRAENERGAVGALLRIGADQARFEVRFGRRVLPIAERAIAVDVADRQAELIQLTPNAIGERPVDAARVSVRDVSEDLDAFEPRRADAAQGIGETVAGVGVGREGQLHAGECWGRSPGTQGRGVR